MFHVFFTTFLALSFFGQALVASDKYEKKCTEKSTHILSYETIQNGMLIRAIQAHFSFDPGKGGQHTAQYENGQIVTQVGNVQTSIDALSLNITGEQTVTMNNLSGGVGFTSVSKDWEIQDGYVVHHHDGFEVHSKKNKQFIITK